VNIVLRLFWHEPSRYPDLVQVTRLYEMRDGSIVLVPTYVKPSEVVDELKKIREEMRRGITKEAFDQLLHKCHLPAVEGTKELNAAITARYSNDWGLPEDPKKSLN
jgi:hypothetical protein